MSLPSSMADFVPCDRLLQKAYCLSTFSCELNFQTACCKYILSDVLLWSIAEYFYELCRTTSKNSQRYYTTKRLKRDLLSNTPNFYVRVGEFFADIYLRGMRDRSMHGIGAGNPAGNPANCLIYTTNAHRSVSEQGHLQPRCHSKARPPSRQL